MLPIVFIMGVSGSGKTTIGKMLAGKTGLPFFDGDDFHPEENIIKMRSGVPLTDEDRRPWLHRLNSLAKEQLDAGAVIACSALKEKYREQLSFQLPKITWIWLDGSFSLIQERLSKRKNHFMPAGLLQSQFNDQEIPDNAYRFNSIEDPETITHQIIGLLGIDTTADQ